MERQGHIVREPVLICSDCVELEGVLSVPERARAIVVFAYAGVNGLPSLESRFLAERLNRAGLGTLLFDLLTANEAQNPRNILDIHRLTHRLIGATKWLLRRNRGNRPRIGYFGAGTGGTAAIIAAAANHEIGAVVTCDGRPDLACYSLPRVKAPTLLVVDAGDAALTRLHHKAQDRLKCVKSLVAVGGTTHLSGERGAGDAVARIARDWFTRHLPAPDAAEAERIGVFPVSGEASPHACLDAAE